MLLIVRGVTRSMKEADGLVYVVVYVPSLPLQVS